MGTSNNANTGGGIAIGQNNLADATANGGRMQVLLKLLLVVITEQLVKIQSLLVVKQKLKMIYQ